MQATKYSRTDILVGISFILLAIIVLLGTIHISEQSRTLPRLCAWGIAAIGVLTTGKAVLRNTVRKSEQETNCNTGTTETLFARREVFLICLILLVTAVIIPLLGFYSSIWLCIVAVYLLYRNEFNRKAVFKGLLFGLIVTVSQFVMFGIFMRLPVPQGILL